MKSIKLIFFAVALFVTGPFNSRGQLAASIFVREGTNWSQQLTQAGYF